MKMPNKKIYNLRLISVGVVIFLIAATSPFWINFGKAAPVPELILTEKAKAAKSCVRPKADIKTEHMKILDDWRNTVVREGKGTFINSEGKEFKMSLSNTCLSCHSNKAEFCDRCHNYASVTPYCWDCHIDKPKES
jgi:hypothetical protein